jgi:hypothetical protein
MPYNGKMKDEIDMTPTPKRGNVYAYVIEVNVIPWDQTTSYRLLKIRDIVQRILHRTLAEVAREKAQPSIGNEIETPMSDQQI